MSPDEEAACFSVGNKGVSAEEREPVHSLQCPPPWRLPIRLMRSRITWGNSPTIHPAQSTAASRPRLHQQHHNQAHGGERGDSKPAWYPQNRPRRRRGGPISPRPTRYGHVRHVQHLARHLGLGEWRVLWTEGIDAPCASSHSIRGVAPIGSSYEARAAVLGRELTGHQGEPRTSA